MTRLTHIMGWLGVCALCVILYQIRTQNPGVPVEAVTTDGKIDIEGTLVFEGADGQCLRMWQIPHRMEMWLMGQKNIRIEDIYYFDHRTTSEPASLRYYIRYQVLKEKP